MGEGTTTIDFQCVDFLQGNHHCYAMKARKINVAFVRVTLTNRQASDVTVLWSSATLTAGGKTFSVGSPADILQELSEFTWDFWLHSLFDIHLLTAAIKARLFHRGPFSDRRLRRQLAFLSIGEAGLRSGESLTAVLAFQGVSKKLERLSLLVQDGDEVREIQHDCIPRERYAAWPAMGKLVKRWILSPLLRVKKPI